MPVIEVTEPAQERLLLERRRLLSPRDAAAQQGVTRQAIDKAAAKADGPYLIWRFVRPGRRDVRHVDFGAREEPPDARAWAHSSSDPRELIDNSIAPSSAPDETEVILHLLASGLVKLSDEWGARRAMPPYPPPLQRALDKLTLRSWRLGLPPPKSVPDLVARAGGPVRRWLPGLPAIVAFEDDVLLLRGLPTSFCREWAVDSVDVEGEILERHLMRTALAVCRKASDQETYIRFRTLLIERPVLTSLELQRYCTDPGLHRLAVQLRECYGPIPIEHVRSGGFPICRTCRHLIVQGPNSDDQCSNDRCPDWSAPEVDRHIPMSQEPRWLRPPIRTFVSLPGLTELRLAEDLKREGVDVSLWPNFDAYDLRVTFPDGCSWAVDVKDWASPVALARHLVSSAPFRSEPPWERAFFVFPSHRLLKRPEYLRVFRHFYRPDGPAAGSTDEQSFLRQVAARLAEIRRRPHA